MLQLRQPQRVLIEADLFDGDFAEREIDRIIGTVALAPKQQFFVHTSRADHLRQWATRGRNPLITGSFIAGHAGLLLKSIDEDALSWKWLRHSPWLHLAGPCLPSRPGISGSVSIFRASAWRTNEEPIFSKPQYRAALSALVPPKRLI